MSDLSRAREIAAFAHEHQCDKSGRPYVEHCRRVAEAVGSHDERIVAFLHDVIEKGRGWSKERLEHEGFSDLVLSAVEALTRGAEEDEESYLRRVAAQPLARPVKRADLRDNLTQALIWGEDSSRYQRARQRLDAIERDDDTPD